jgi:hypothetical protein
MKEQDCWETRISEFAKIMGKSVAVVEEALGQKPFELTKDTPCILEMLSDEEIVPFGDLRKIFSDDMGISLPKLRMGIKFLRGPKEDREKEISPNVIAMKNKYGIDIRMEDLTLEQLLEFYNPSKKDKVYEILKDKYESKYGAFIAYKPGTKEVAIDEVLNYVTDLDTGYNKDSSIEVDEELCRLYKVGEVPNETFDEDPLFIGVPLKRERSQKNRVSWECVELEIRQFFRILLREKLINPHDRVAIGTIIGKPIKELKQIFPEAYLIFKEKKETNTLDPLKVHSSNSNKVQDPFSMRG